jgi:hypothetical protein
MNIPREDAIGAGHTLGVCVGSWKIVVALRLPLLSDAGCTKPCEVAAIA